MSFKNRACIFIHLCNDRSTPTRINLGQAVGDRRALTFFGGYAVEGHFNKQGVCHVCERTNETEHVELRLAQYRPSFTALLGLHRRKI